MMQAFNLAFKGSSARLKEAVDGEKAEHFVEPDVCRCREPDD